MSFIAVKDLLVTNVRCARDAETSGTMANTLHCLNCRWIQWHDPEVSSGHVVIRTQSCHCFR